MRRILLPAVSIILCAGGIRAQGLFAGQRPGQLREDNGAGLRLRWCPPGEFIMGSPLDEPGRDDDEDQHPVTLTRGFWLGETEVTQGQWQAVMGRGLRDQARLMLDDPTVYRMGGQDVTLRDVAKPHGKDEAASVAAAYAGPMTVLGNNNVPVLHEIAWYGGNSGRNYGGRGWTINFPDQAYPGTRAGPRRVGQLEPNAWQLRDMLGNLYEWVEDYSGYYPQRPVTDPAGPASGEKKLFRVGSWNHYGTMCRAARRFEEIPTIRLNYIGFRVALRLTR
jgi:formylglycine-generating enzyme required for sulfatase activity